MREDFWTAGKQMVVWCVLVLLLTVMASAQTPPVTVDLNKAELYWTWTQGTGGPVEKWLIRCGPTPGNLNTLREIATPAARAYLIKDIPLTTGTWTCTVQGANTFGAGLPGPSVTFQAGQTPGSVDSLGIR